MEPVTLSQAGQFQGAGCAPEQRGAGGGTPSTRVRGGGRLYQLSRGHREHRALLVLAH